MGLLSVARTCVAALAIMAGPAFAQAPSNPEMLERVYACADVQEADARLACFDAAVAGLRQAQATGEFAAVDREAVQRVEREAFGFSLPSLPRLSLPNFGAGPRDNEPELDSMAMTIARISTRPDGLAVFIMTNGQRWVQVEQQRMRSARPGGAVTIRRAALGSFLMSVEAGGPAHRVRREE